MSGPFWGIPRLWPGATAVSIGGGPSMTQAQADYVRGRAKVVAINDAYRLAPWADLFYFCDFRWFEWHKHGLLPLGGIKVTLENNYIAGRGVFCIKNRGVTGLWTNPPDGVCTGRNSGYQVINLLVLLGVKRIVLLGYDMKPGENGKKHWFGDHPRPTPDNAFGQMLPCFDTIVDPLKKLGVEVINATPGSALESFPKMTLEEAFAPRTDPNCPLCKGEGIILPGTTPCYCWKGEPLPCPAPVA